ncbi:MAG: cysteine dioxygenase [Synechococcus sp.]
MTTPASLALPAKLRSLTDQLGGLQHPSKTQLLGLIDACHLTADDLEAWADRDHPATDSYGRRLAWRNRNIELMVMTWLPGDHSAIHDHGSAEWGAVQCFGEASHQSFTLEGMHLISQEHFPYSPGQIQWVNGSLIHQMGNSGSDTFLSLHVYGTSQDCVDITAGARVFNLESACIETTNGGVFFDLPESAVLSRQDGLTADPDLKQEQFTLLQQRRRLAMR